jgi:hypothetical protein
MRVRSIVTAAAALALAAAVSAEPTKVPVQKAEQSAGESPVIVAAADETPQPTASNTQSATPQKPERHARVTTCRCGDQNPGN